METKEANKGTGAGGAQTNINGKKLENRVRDIVSNASKIKNTIYIRKTSKKTGNTPKITEIEINDKIFIRAYETMFEKWEKDYCNSSNKDINKLHGSKRPDDCLINPIENVINFLECKSQNGPGSVAEKLQTCTKKIRNLKRRFPGWTINYNYILDAYFKEKAKAEIADLDEDGIPYIWTDDPEFEKKILNIIR